MHSFTTKVVIIKIFVGNLLITLIEQPIHVNCFNNKIILMKPTNLLKFSLLFLILIIISVGTSSAGDNDKKTIRINPAYKINRISNGSVIVTSRNPGDVSVKHEFSDFYADLLMAAYRKQSMGIITDTLKKKYYMSEDECRRELKHAINTLSEWKIIIRDEDMAMH